MRLALMALVVALGTASWAEGQAKKNINVTPTVEMVQTDGSAVDLVKVQECGRNVALTPRDTEFTNRTLAKDERMETAEFAGMFRRMAAYYNCLDSLGYVMRSRVVLPK